MKHVQAGALILSAAVGLALQPAVVSADAIELVNGDRINGTVVGLTADELRLESEVLGELKIPRSKVGAIYLGDFQPRGAAAPVSSAAPQQPAASPAALLPGLGSDGGATPEELIRRIQKEGINRTAIGDIQKQFPLLADPAAKKYFNDTLTGLATGEKGVQDIRRDAVKARDVLLDLKKDLGPDGAALNGYLGILNKFIDETAPAEGEIAEDPAKPETGTPETSPKK